MTNVAIRPPRTSRFPFIPAPIRHLLWKASVTGRMSARIAWWKLANAGLVARSREVAARPAEGATVTALQNRLPNSGGFRIEATPESVIAGIKNPRARRADEQGFEGLALDDALTFTDDYKHLSYIPLSKAFLEIGRRELGKPQFSVLELGCGGGSFAAFLGAQGIKDYLGVDVNTVAYTHSPWIRDRQAHFRLLNLQQDIDFGSTFDLVCTFEVLEHIREDKLDHLVGTIARHVGPSSIFLGTASLLEDGDVHVTVKERPFWLAKFAVHGLVEHPRHQEIENALGVAHPFNWWPEVTNVFAMVKAKP